MKFLRHLIVVMLAAIFAEGASAQAPIFFEITREETGGLVAPLNTVGDDLCPSVTSSGCDFSISDNIVRTNDALTYEFAVRVDPPGDEVSITAVLDPGLVWTDIPGLCDPFTSAITGDGSAGAPSELFCDLGFQSAQATNLLAAAEVMGTVPNGATLGIDAARFEGTSSPAVTANIGAATDIVVTASPRLDVRFERSFSRGATVNGVTGAEIFYSGFVGLWNNDRNGNPSDTPDPLVGNELITQPVSFTFDLSRVSPNAIVERCLRGSGSQIPLPVFDPTRPDQSLSNAGTISCSPPNANPGSIVTLTITGADFSFAHVPTRGNANNLIRDFPEYRYASIFQLGIFIPIEDVNNAGGTLSTNLQIENLTLTSITGQQNFNGAGEDLTNNTRPFTVVDLSGSRNFSYRCRVPGGPTPACGPNSFSPPTNASGIFVGDGTITPEETVSVLNQYSNRSFRDATIVDLCSIFDTRYSQPALYNGTDVVNCDRGCDNPGVDHIIEYSNTYVDPSFRDLAELPPRAVPNECSTPTGWTSNLAAAQAAGPITKIRIRRLQPLPSGGLLRAWHYVQALTNTELTGVPNGTLVRTWGVQRSDTDSRTEDDDYFDCAYRSGSFPTPSHLRRGCGDRVALTRGVVRIQKTTVPGDNVNTLEAGNDVIFSLAPTFSTVGANFTETMTVVDELPPNTSYVLGSATQDGVAFEPVVTGTPAAGQILTWDLGPQQANTAIPPIEFRMSTPNNTPGGTILTNVARVASPADISEPAEREDRRSLSVSRPRSMLMGKSVSDDTVERDGALTYTVEYENSTNEAFMEMDTIDILPYLNDGRIPASSFSGTIQLATLATQSNSAQFYVSSATPSAILSDPQAAANDLANGTTPWCATTPANTIDTGAVPSSSSASGGCPATTGDVTAIRLVDTQPLAPGQARSFEIAMATSGNVGGDIYTNQAQATSDIVSLSPTTPFVSTTVIGAGVLQASKTVETFDQSIANGYNISDTEVLYTINIQNVGDGVVDQDSIFLVDAFPPQLDFWNGDIGNGGPVMFVQSAGSGLSFDPTQDIRFSTSTTQPTNFSECSDRPVNEQFLDDVTFICFNPKGTMEFGTPNPEISLSFRARIR